MEYRNPNKYTLYVFIYYNVNKDFYAGSCSRVSVCVWICAVWLVDSTVYREDGGICGSHTSEIHSDGRKSSPKKLNDQTKGHSGRDKGKDMEIHRWVKAKSCPIDKGFIPYRLLVALFLPAKRILWRSTRQTASIWHLKITVLYPFPNALYPFDFYWSSNHFIRTGFYYSPLVHTFRLVRIEPNTVAISSNAKRYLILTLFYNIFYLIFGFSPKSGEWRSCQCSINKYSRPNHTLDRNHRKCCFVLIYVG